MPDPADVLAPLTPQALAVLRHPEPSAWAVALELTLSQPVDIGSRIVDAHRAVPMMGARLTERGWETGGPPPVEVGHGPVLLRPELLRPFWLHADPPLRVAMADDRMRVAFVGHHAAFDGLGLLALATAVIADRLPNQSAEPHARGGGRGVPMWSRVAELTRPAHRVAPSAGGAGEVLRARRLTIGGAAVTSRVAAACVAAVAAHNRARQSRWQRVGLSVAVGGPPGIGNVASYRRIDLRVGEDVAAAVTRALAEGKEPIEFGRAPMIPSWAAPLARRLSDSLLVSNLGRHALPGVSSVAFYPVARGRSAVAFGLAGVAGAQSTISLRSLHLSADDADRLLDDVVRRLAAPAVTVTEAERHGPGA